MANLPAPVDKPELPPAEINFRNLVLDGFAQGMNRNEIARMLAKGDTRAYKRYRRKIRRLSESDEVFHSMLSIRARAMLAEALLPTVAGLSRRAARGRTDAAKIVLEASGFHNPRVQHDHSGEIHVKLDLPRPKAIEAEAEEIVDAEVVDD